MLFCLFNHQYNLLPSSKILSTLMALLNELDLKILKKGINITQILVKNILLNYTYRPISCRINSWSLLLNVIQMK